MLTGSDDSASITRAFEAGATDFISKPVNWPVLGQRARYLLRNVSMAQSLAALLSAVPDMMFVLDRHCIYRDFKAGIGLVPFLPPESFLGKAVHEVLPPELATLIEYNIQRVVETGDVMSHAYVLGKGEELRYFEARYAPFGPNEVLAVVRDITQNTLNEEHIRHLAYYDSLTGMPNRQHFHELLEGAMGDARLAQTKLALMFLDLDGFKRINDTLGHDVGDKLLQSVAERLRVHLRGSDKVFFPAATAKASNIARLGGDEFTVLIPVAEQYDVMAEIARRICVALEEPFICADNEIAVTTSIGIAIFPDDGNDAATLLKHADRAMYHAKGQGRNNWQFFSADMELGARERLNMEHELRQAMADDALTVLYQPLVRSSSMCVDSFEALSRWQHPVRGLISPDEFIPVAEEMGLIIPLGERVLRKVCRQVQQWLSEGIPAVRVAVNVSGHQVREYDFADKVIAILQEEKVGGEYIRIELTESVLMSSAPHVIGSLKRLTQYGITIAIDDFGTGYSSIAYLKHFPISELKIDKCFIDGIPHDNQDAEVTAAILAMVKHLHLEVVAEGVETVEQLDFLVAADCDLLQGFLLSRPVPGVEAGKLLLAGPLWESAGPAASVGF
jgi:diguanylate cyclase (GGDEF)-like protein